MNKILLNQDAKLIIMKKLAYQARLKCLEIAKTKTGCHLGGSLSVIDVLIVLFNKFYNRTQGDTIILSKGHASAGLYSVLYVSKLISIDPALEYGKSKSIFTGHPNNCIEHIEFSTGSLGHGPSLGIGWAVSQKLKQQKGIAYVILGDGELQEGSCWEAFQVAIAKHIGQLVFIIDHNKAQNDGYVNDIVSLGNLKEKLSSFGAECLVIDGHDYEQIIQAIKSIPTHKPLFIIANTIKGKGIKSIENNPLSHYMVLKEQTFINFSNELKYEINKNSLQR